MQTIHGAARHLALAALLAAPLACATTPAAGAVAAGTDAPAAVASPGAAAVAELLATDRAFAAAAAGADLPTALGRMFAPTVYMLAPGGGTRSAAEADAALRRNPAAATARIAWTPIRGGASADGRHGFTYGYTTVTLADGTVQPGKYVAYWIRGADGWRVATYKRVPRPAGAVSLAERAPAVPPAGLAAGDSAAVARYRDELTATEAAFSAEAQTMRLGQAFTKYSAPDAAHTGGGTDTTFNFGPEAIGRGIDASLGPGAPPTLTWAADAAHAAATGDLGVTMGTIVIVQPAAEGRPAQTARVPYFTIWRRGGPGQPWRLVAE